MNPQKTFLGAVSGSRLFLKCAELVFKRFFRQVYKRNFRREKRLLKKRT